VAEATPAPPPARPTVAIVHGTILRGGRARLGTANAAWVCGQEEALGTPEGGKLADVPVLDGDLPPDPEVTRRPRSVVLDGVPVRRVGTHWAPSARWAGENP